MKKSKDHYNVSREPVCENAPCLCGAYDHKNGSCFDKPAHTPLPWHADTMEGDPIIVSSTREIVAVMDSNNQQVNAAFIVKSVNYHEKLIKFVAHISLMSTLGALRDQARAILAKVEGR